MTHKTFNIPKPEIVIDKGNIENVSPFEPVKAIFSLIFPEGYGTGYYLWEIDDVKHVTANKTIELTLPNSYCGKQQILKVSLTSRTTQFEYTKQTTQEDIICLEASQLFFPICRPPKLRDMYFYDEERRIKIAPNSTLKVNSWVIVIAEVSGLNGCCINRNDFIIKIDGAIVYTGTLFNVRIERNTLKFPVLIEESWFSNIAYEKIVKLSVVLYPLMYASINKEININVINNRKRENVKIVPLTQPVVVGKPNIRESNFKPCRYSKITASFKNQNSLLMNTILFDEDSSTTLTKELYIVGGNRKITITLSNYSTKGCTTNIHKNNQALFLSKDHLIVEESGFTFRSPEDNKYYYTISNSGTFTFGVQFRYLSKASLFNYFWDAKPQQGILQISTCRYIKDISLFLYPDIEWSVSIDIGKQVEFYSHTNMPAGDTYKRHQDKARETGHMRKFNVADMSITLSLEAQYNDGEKESLSFEFGERIKDTLNFWGTLKKGLDTLSFKDKLPTGQSFKPKIGKIPIFIEIESPQIHIEGSWKYNIINNNQLVREGSLTFGLKPLVKGRGGIDVIAALEYIPQAKAIISAIRSANTTLEKGVDLISSGEIKYEASMWFNIYIFGSIECQGSIELSKVGTQELESKTSIGLGVEIGVKAGASTATIIVKGKQKSASIEAALEASAKGETSVSFSGLCGLDNIGPFIELKAIFDGLTITVIGKAQILTRKKNRVSTYGPEINKPYEIIKKTTLAEKRIHFLN